MSQLLMTAAWQSSTTDFRLGHQGLSLDTESGLYYNRARMLHPTMGTFTSRDPLGYVDEMNVYQYENGVPSLLLDPTGHLVFLPSPVPLPRPMIIPRPTPYPSPLPLPRPVPPIMYYEGDGLRWSWPLMPENERDYRQRPYPRYDPKTNPDCDTDNPCGSLVSAYTSMQKRIDVFVKGSPPKAGWDCDRWKQYYSMVLEAWEKRLTADQCHQRHDIGAPEDHRRHAKQTNDWARWRDAVYERMRDKCNETRYQYQPGIV